MTVDTHDTKNIVASEGARETVWMKHGTTVPKNSTALKAIKAGGLDWEVGLAPVTTIIDGTEVEVPNRFATYRTDTGHVFDVVGKDYEPIQNRDAFAVADDLRKTLGVEFQRAGEVADGRRCWLQGTFGVAYEVVGDKHQDNLIIDTAHNGLQSTRLAISPVRLECLNMMMMALRQASFRWGVRHTSTASERLGEAHLAVEAVQAYKDEYTQLAEHLIGKSMGKQAAKTFLTRLLPDRPRTPQVIEDILRLAFEADTCENGRGTKWAMLNAVREYFDHVKPQRTTESAFINATTGVNVQMASKAAAMLVSASN